MKVYITRQIPEIGINILKDAGFDVKISTKDGVLTREELLNELKEYNPDAVIPLLTDKINAEVFDATPNAKIYATYSVGFNHIDLEEARKRGIMITNTPGVLTDAVAEFTWALIFALARRVIEGDTFTRDGKYKGWAPQLLLGMQLKGKTLGILGAGRIGTRVGEIASSLGMDIIYSDIKENKILNELGGRFANKDKVLAEADIITVHVPLLDSTRHYISNDEFNIMKDTALLINTSRGPVVDESALVTALQNHQVGGAALDVFEFEPDVNKSLVEMDNVILTPHIASATTEARNKMSELAGQSIVDFFAGKIPQHVVK